MRRVQSRIINVNHTHQVNTFCFQGNTAAAQLGALNMNPAYRNLAPQQLTAAQQQQLLLQQGLNPSQVVTKMITFFCDCLILPLLSSTRPSSSSS